MATFEYIIVESKGAVGIITLNRPKMLNALSFGVFREIAAAVDDLEADDKIGCILLTGSEKAFAAGTPAAIPPSVANANAQLASDAPTDAQVAPDAHVVASDQLNDTDRAMRDNPAPATPVASNEAPAARSAPVMAASGEHSVWDETSLIGKIFIGFGAVLTIASAARMFMA